MSLHRSIALLIALAVLALANAAIGAQINLPQDGDCVVIGHDTSTQAVRLDWFAHDGKSIGNLVNSTALTAVGGLTPAPQNNGVLFTCVPHLSYRHVVYHLDRFGKLSTVATLPASVISMPVLTVDQSGDLVFLNYVPKGSSSELLRRTSSGAFTTIVAGLPLVVAFEEDLLSGDFLLADLAGDVRRVTPLGQVISVAKGVLPALATVRANMRTDHGDGSMVVTWQNRVMRYQPATATATLLALSGSAYFVGLDHDPIHGRYYRMDVSAGASTLVRYDPATGAVAALSGMLVNSFAPYDLTTWGSRILCGVGPATPGAAYGIDVGLYSEAGRSYQAAASFGCLRGIPTAWGRIPLDADPLFFLSVTDPLVFRNFAGSLSRSGTARMTVQIPKLSVLRGLRFFLAVITYDVAGIRRISEPLGVTIR